ncbi:hypothetical protein AALO_G00111320 [Alosa alosa]|uniref:C2H2-type domain-containing protein n=1 Tax=Alosa alosa TaxID=278164 RepID=A0AAV6GSJ9_9TELE|nr:hypothetical protein AALO_G00111320 [Alosa alosa]
MLPPRQLSEGQGGCLPRRNISAKTCNRSFLYEKSYLKHLSKTHGERAEVTYRCGTCQHVFANRSNLKIHEQHVHSEERCYLCDACGKGFKRRKDVRRHQKQVHEGGSQRHMCPTCGKALSSRTALKLHERTHTGYKPFECGECNAKFSQSSALKTHKRIHTGEKPFACDECDAKFTQNHMLLYHKRCHTGERPFMCEICGKNFASKKYLKHHTMLHSGYKPHKCEICERPFAQMNSLHQHMKTHTGERPYQCTECDKNFTQLKLPETPAHPHGREAVHVHTLQPHLHRQVHHASARPDSRQGDAMEELPEGRRKTRSQNTVMAETVTVPALDRPGTVTVASPTLEAALLAGEIQCVTVGETDLTEEAAGDGSGSSIQLDVTGDIREGETTGNMEAMEVTTCVISE